jgi:hypothetical protein
MAPKTHKVLFSSEASLFCMSCILFRCYFPSHLRLTCSNCVVVGGMPSSFISLHLSHKTLHFHFCGTVCFGCLGIFIYFLYCYCTIIYTFFERLKSNLLRRQAFFWFSDPTTVISKNIRHTASRRSFEDSARAIKVVPNFFASPNVKLHLIIQKVIKCHKTAAGCIHCPT